MFGFIIRYFRFLKSVPILAQGFDGMLRLHTLLLHPNVLRFIDDIEARLSDLRGIQTAVHKYGGLQFNYGSIEIGHIHSNGLLDMRLNRSLKAELMRQGRIKDHHTFKNTGWISFYIKTEEDRDYAITLLQKGYDLRHFKILPSNWHK